MSYLAISTDEALNIIELSRGDKIVMSEILDGHTTTDNISRKAAEELIRQSPSIYFNNDEVVKKLSLLYDNTGDRLIDLIFAC